MTASARSDVPPFMVMDVMAAAARIEAAGGHVIHMEVGQPSAPAPKAAIAAAQGALSGGRIDYTSALGIPSLRERIARHYRESYGCAVNAGQIVITTGSSGAFILAFLAMFEPGDHPRLFLEPSGKSRVVKKLGRQYLQRHCTLEAGVVRLVDRRHPSLSKDTDELKRANGRAGREGLGPVVDLTIEFARERRRQQAGRAEASRGRARDEQSAARETGRGSQIRVTGTRTRVLVADSLSLDRHRRAGNTARNGSGLRR